MAKTSPRLMAALALGLCLPLAQVTANEAAAPVEGVWMTLLKSEITVLPCPEGFCGYITKIVVPDHVVAENGSQVTQMAVEQFIDFRNKDPNLRNRPIMGLKILTLRQGKEPHIFDGEIYNPEDGNTYSGYVEVTGPNGLRLNGCVLFNVVCRGEDWIRVATPEEIAAPEPTLIAQ